MTVHELSPIFVESIVEQLLVHLDDDLCDVRIAVCRVLRAVNVRAGKTATASEKMLGNVRTWQKSSLPSLSGYDYSR